MILLNAVILLLIDSIWLYIISKDYSDVINLIQGYKMIARPLYAIPVYLALAYLMTFANNYKEAFMIGLTTYAVYDFTVLALFHRYPLKMAIMDTLWGGILMSLAYLAILRIKNKV